MIIRGSDDNGKGAVADGPCLQRPVTAAQIVALENHVTYSIDTLVHVQYYRLALINFLNDNRNSSQWQQQ